MLKPSLQLRIGQQLTMTPQLQQAIRLLQLPSLDLQAHVRETLETNVMLEAEDESGAGGAARGCARARRARPPRNATPSSTATATPAGQREEPEVEIARRRLGRAGGGPAAATGPGRATTTAAAISATSTARRCRSSSSSSSSSPSSPPIDLAIARVITDAITDDGYLTDDLEDIRAESAARDRGQPPRSGAGAGGRAVARTRRGRRRASLGECIALQLRQLHPDTPARDVAIRVALEHLDLVAGQQLRCCAASCAAAKSDLEMALALVRSCHPRPGAAVNPAQAEYVVPDVFVRRDRARLDRRDQPGDRAAGARQPELCQPRSRARPTTPCCALSCRRRAG